MTVDQAYGILACAIVLPALGMAAWSDVRERRIPNWLVLSTLIMAFVARGYCYGVAGLAAGGVGMLAGLGIPFLLWLGGFLGPGDAKLMGAAGAWLGAWGVAGAMIVGGLLGGVLGVVVIARQRAFGRAWTNLVLMTVDRASREAVVEKGAGAGVSTLAALPYGVPLAGGVAVVLVFQVLFGG